MSSLFTSTLALNFRRSGARAANSSSSPLTTASTCSSGARVPHPGQRTTGSLWMSETSMEKDSSHFWHWNSSCMTAASRPAQHSHGFPPWKGGMKISRRLSLTRRSARPRRPCTPGGGGAMFRAPDRSRSMPSPAPQVPKNGKAITISGGRLAVPDQPILPFIEGDGTGPDIWRASQRALDAAVEKAYGGGRRGGRGAGYRREESKKLFGNWLPDEAGQAFRQ